MPIPANTQQAKNNFKRWFGKSVVRDYDGSPLVVYHGTTYQFDQFSKNKGDPRNFFGKDVIYFTDSADDASENYAGVGPDMRAKIDRIVENGMGANLMNLFRFALLHEQPWATLVRTRIGDLAPLEWEFPRVGQRTLGYYLKQMREELHEELTISSGAKSGPKTVARIKDIYESSPEDFKEDAFYSTRLDPLPYLCNLMALDALDTQSLGHVLPVFLKIERPAYYKDEDHHDSEIRIRFRETEEGNYEPVKSDFKTWNALDATLSAFDLDIEDFLEYFAETGGRPAYFEDGVKISDFHDALSDWNENNDNDYGTAGSIVAHLLENLGYDGIIMGAEECLPGMSCIAGAIHYMVFDPCQVKSALHNKGTFSKTNCKLTETKVSSPLSPKYPSGNCPNCQGTGSPVCCACRGTGRWGDSNVNCQDCNGEERVGVCDDCHGTGGIEE